jgi:hypothetical protein
LCKEAVEAKIDVVSRNLPGVSEENSVIIRIVDVPAGV